MEPQTGIIATLGLHLGFSAKPRIWQVPTCKMEPDLEKVVNRPQAENSELYNVLKIAGFATKDKQI